VPLGRRRNPLWPLVLAALLALLALYMWQGSQAVAYPRPWQALAGVLLGAAVVIVFLRLLRRRRAR
jgi:hypothetical protein